jgi:hypothetical protein
MSNWEEDEEALEGGIEIEESATRASSAACGEMMDEVEKGPRVSESVMVKRALTVGRYCRYRIRVSSRHLSHGHCRYVAAVVMIKTKSQLMEYIVNRAVNAYCLLAVPHSSSCSGTWVRARSLAY